MPNPPGPQSARLRKLLLFLPDYFFGLGASAYLFSAGVVSGRHRTLIKRICQHFGRQDAAPLNELPEVEPSEIFGGLLNIAILEADPGDGNVSFLELALLNTLVRRHAARSLFEIGTFDGRTALNLAANTVGGAKVFTLDLPPDGEASTALAVDEGDRIFIRQRTLGRRFASSPYRSQITQLLGDSAAFDYGAFERMMDFVFVDGSHAYEYVHSDARVASKLLRPEGGWIAFHDYGGEWQGVTRALNELRRGGGGFEGLRHVKGTSLALVEIKR